MANRIEKIPLDNGQHVLVEVHDVGGELKRCGIGDKAIKTFEAAWDTVQPVIETLAKKIVHSGPTETQIKFGIKLSADLNAFIASSKGEANFEVTLSWKAQQ